MSRMFDRLMLSDDIRAARRAQIEKVACIINADECARYFFDSKLDDGEQCFINMAPPFSDPFWIEYRVPNNRQGPLESFSHGALITPHDHGADQTPRWTVRFEHFAEKEKGKFMPRGIIDFHVGPDGAVLRGSPNLTLQRMTDTFKWEAGGLSVSVSPEGIDTDEKMFKVISDFMGGMDIAIFGATPEDAEHKRSRTLAVAHPPEIQKSIADARAKAVEELGQDGLEKKVDDLVDKLNLLGRRLDSLHAVTACHPMAFAISLMHCKNVELRPVEPIEALSRAQFKRRGRPLVRYHELHIEPMKAVLKTEGGAESVGLAKALHIARGHFKDFRNGKGLFGRFKGVYWWPQHLRGNAEEGVVHKGYRVDPPNVG